MAHKRVIVIGSNPELQLQRFNHEKNEFNQDLFTWIEDELSLKELERQYDEGFHFEHYHNGKLTFTNFNENVEFGKAPNLTGNKGIWTTKKIRYYEIHPTFDDYLKSQELLLNEDRTKVGSMSNPYGKIDEFILGARYKNCFVTKAGYSSQVKKGEIDFDCMKVAAFDEAHELQKLYKSECSKREICHQEAFIKYGRLPEESQERYYQRFSKICEVVVLNGKWIETEDESKKYSFILDGYTIDEFLEIIKDVEADSLISMYDCHW